MLARRYQTLEFVKHMHNTFKIVKHQKPLWECLEYLNTLIDVSDPDLSHPNLYHAVQTAEMIRRDGLPDWFQLIGLIHDLGKIMYLRGNDEEGTGRRHQWAMVGDTFLVGCRIPDTIIFPEFNQEHPDMKDTRYNTEYGIYSPHCGLDNTYSSWGHDEYLYQLLTHPNNKNTLPKEALYIVRFHSLYLYHEKDEYQHLMSPHDHKMKTTLKTFNQYDLYSKSDEIYDIEKLKPYYLGLIQKYFCNEMFYF